MSARKEGTLSRRDAFGLLRQMTSELDHMFEDPFWRSFRPTRPTGDRATSWSPEVDVFEKDNRLFTRIDLPGMKKEDVKVEVTDGHLEISGERKSEVEEKKGEYYRCERAYGSFYRAVPLPDGVNLEDITATFADGVLEVSVPLAKAVAAVPRKVEIKEPAAAAKSAAA
jgi:HSP20 family protein